MIFIFGYHPLTKNIGPEEEKTCPNCSNTRHWILGKMTYYINLFFIPVIPTKTQFYSQCPVCQFRQELTREEFHQREPLARLNKEAVASNMSEKEYEERIKNI